MKKYLVVLLLTLGMECCGMDVFSQIIQSYATKPDLQQRLSNIRTTNKEADLFIKKYYERCELATVGFESDVIERVESAADLIGRSFYEEAQTKPTDTELLEKALLFMKKDGSGSGVDSVSEAAMNSSDSLRKDAEHLLQLRKKYNEAKTSGLQSFLQGLTELLSK